MPTITVEKVGQQADINQASRLYRVHGTASMAAAEALVQAEVDADGDFDSKPFYHLETNETALQTWDIRAIYKNADTVIFPQGEDEVLVSFSTGGETQTLYFPVADAPDGDYAHAESGFGFNLPGINYDSTGSIQGVEVPVRSFDFTMTIYKNDDDVTIDYLRAIYEARNTTNAESIDIDWGTSGNPKVVTFLAGELLLADVSGGRINPSRWQFVFNMRFSPNRNGADGTDPVPLSELGFESAGTIKKDGHNYLWIHYIREEQTIDAKTITNDKPVAAYSDKVFHDSDFSLLELPDGQ